MCSTFLIDNTPIERYEIKNKTIFVKREDLCIAEAKFSKLRGVYSHLEKRLEKYIGVLDSYHSKAGWGVSYLCSRLNKQCVVFYPEYKNEPGYRESQKNALRFGAVLEPLLAGRSCILYYRAKKLLKEKYLDSYMIPNALKLQESIDETRKEVGNTPIRFFENFTWIVSISSGTIAIGVIKGLIENKAKVKVILHMGYSRSELAVMKYLSKHIKDIGSLDIKLVDEKYGYKDKVEEICPFPCNKYYDLKAWKWLINNDELLGKNILFWNIGE